MAADEKSDNKKSSNKKKGDGIRETVESIAIAFILAFLFKTFQAEAYVIPTGSMAPTLYGRHKDVTCDGCGFSFALGASSELDQHSGLLQWRIDEVYCSNCGKRVQARDAPVYNGDRIIVNKRVSGYERFDVVVFKNPEEGHVNYIKRLVGLPGETIRIRRGDIWARTDDTDWKIQRKEDPFVQKDIQLTVYDDLFPATPLLEMGWPERWASCEPNRGPDSVGGWIEAENGWMADSTSRKYACSADGEDLHWLRYRHFQPNESTWPHPQQVAPELPEPQASLIADFCSFNAYRPGFPGSTYWVGDLTINASVEVHEARGDVLLELVEGPHTFRCVIDLASGRAELLRRDTNSEDEFESIASGATEMSAAGTYEVSFANVDDRLCLWVDDTLVKFDAPTEYEDSDVPQPTDHDLAPCGIACRGARVTVSGLLLQRDIYYRNDIIAFDHESGISLLPTYDNDVQHNEVPRPYELQSQLHDPEGWAAAYAHQAATQLEKYGEYGEYELADDEYLMFGDNSSMSKDSRLFDYQARPMNGVFSHRYAVREQDLIGKALFIFWPHGIPFMNGGKGFPVWYHRGRKDADPGEYPSMRAPFYPNIWRMKKIR